MNETINILAHMDSPSAFAILFICGSIAAGIIAISTTVTIRRGQKLDHQEKMAKLETEHRETMLKIQRDNPKVIENRSQEKR